MKIDEFSKTGLILTQTEITHITGGVTCICISVLPGYSMQGLIVESKIDLNSEVVYLDAPKKGIGYGIVTKRKDIAHSLKWADSTDCAKCKTICCGDKHEGYLWAIEGSNASYC